MNRRKNTQKTISFLSSFFELNSETWFSSIFISKQTWKAAKAGNWLPAARIGRILSELEAIGLIERSKNGLWWRREISVSRSTNDSDSF